MCNNIIKMYTTQSSFVFRLNSLQQHGAKRIFGKVNEVILHTTINIIKKFATFWEIFIPIIFLFCLVLFC
jgi:hypothetical protein